MRRAVSRFLTCLVLVTGCATTGPRTSVTAMQPEAAADEELAAWLREHGGCVALQESDYCCPALLSEARTAQGTMQPFHVRGDFNGDGHDDLATGVRDGAGMRKYLVFNGPLGRGAPPVWESPWVKGNEFLFVARHVRGDRRVHLILGALASDGWPELVPEGKTYTPQTPGGEEQ